MNKLRVRVLLDYSTPTGRVEFSKSALSLTAGLLPPLLYAEMSHVWKAG